MAITISEERGVRYLHFGSPWVQGAMRISRPWALELEYTRDLMFPLLLRPADWPRTVLQVGLGSASVTKFLYRHRPEARITVVEILPEVVETARRYFRLPEDAARVRIELADGHDYIQKRGAKFDLVVVDGFDEKGRSGMLDTEGFYLACKSRLAREGMISVNLLTRRRGTDASEARIRKAFDGRAIRLPPSEAGNTVVIAATGAGIRTEWKELRVAARELHAAAGLNLMPAVQRLAKASPGGEAVVL